MAKPIPVFAFAYAAYAATSERSAGEFRADPPEEQDADTIFLAVCRAPFRAGAVLTVKLGLLVDESGRAVGLLDRHGADAGEVEDLWLGQIVEGRGGFSGVVRATPERRVGGQRISFELRHVLGWRLEAHAPRADAATLTRPLRGGNSGAPKG